ncbi:MAG: hypothetical protein IIB53_16250 [Planctomycetes bacterium]|nr:hypothetical protein [Planctomycetota bacterium]
MTTARPPPRFLAALLRLAHQLPVLFAQESEFVVASTIATIHAFLACASHCATWVGEDEHGDREYMLDCLD